MWRIRAFSLVGAVLLSFVAQRAEAKPGRVPKAMSMVRPKSVGSPDQGTLVGGKKLEPNENLRAVGGHRFGLPELVDLLTRGAAEVAKKHPRSVLNVGDLSRRGGGEVDGHRSHESGRDADVGFYLSKNGKPFVAPRFAAIDADGKAAGFPGVRFDDARNWTLIQTFLTDPKAHVLQIFVSNPVRKRLLDEAARAGASQAIRARAAEILFQPTRGLPHDNHFHVRIACPKGNADCVNFGKRALTKATGRKRGPAVAQRTRSVPKSAKR
jgi:penicillin-insensitive murein DD-endopeptidase